MDLLIEFLQLTVPAALVLYGMFLTVKSFTTKELDKTLLELRTRNTETVLPIRLQAYERICLFLERISPNNMVMRLNEGKMTAKQLQARMLADIRDEYNHNVSQQVYMSEDAWNYVKTAKEDLITVVNRASESMKEDSTGIDLAKQIFQVMMEKEKDPITEALSFVKDEIRQSF